MRWPDVDRSVCSRGCPIGVHLELIPRCRCSLRSDTPNWMDRVRVAIEFCKSICFELDWTTMARRSLRSRRSRGRPLVNQSLPPLPPPRRRAPSGPTPQQSPPVPRPGRPPGRRVPAPNSSRPVLAAIHQVPFAAGTFDWSAAAAAFVAAHPRCHIRNVELQSSATRGSGALAEVDISGWTGSTGRLFAPWEFHHSLDRDGSRHHVNLQFNCTTEQFATVQWDVRSSVGVGSELAARFWYTEPPPTLFQ
nr:putative long-distance movement protein [arborvitae Umbra-like virus]